MIRKIKRLFFIFNKRYYRRRFIEELNEVSNQYSEPDNWEMENKLKSEEPTEEINPEIFKGTLVYHRFKFNIYIHQKSGYGKGFLYINILDHGEFLLFIVHYSDIEYLLNVANGKARERWLFLSVLFLSFQSEKGNDQCHHCHSSCYLSSCSF